MFNKLNSSKIFTFLLSGFLLVNIFIIFIINFFLLDSKKLYQEQAYTTSKNLTYIFNDNIDKFFDKTDLIINSINNQITNFGLSSSTKNFINEEFQHFKDLNNIIFINNDGKVIYAAKEFTNKNFSDEIFFKETIQSNKNILINHIFINNEKYIIFSKKIVDTTNNKIIGVLTLIFPINSFLQNFNNFITEQNVFFALVDENLKFIVCNVCFSQSKTVQENSFYSKTFISLSSKMNTGTYEEVSPLDQKLRVFSFKKNNRFNYFVIVGLSKEDFLIPWNKELFKFITIYFFFIIIYFLFCYIIYLLWKKESQKENKLSSILESSNEGIYGIDNKGLCTFCNHKALTLLGYTEESELLGKPINEIIFTEKLSEKELINNLNIEKIMKRKDNTTFYAQICKHPQIYNNEISNSIITFIDLSDKKNIDKLIWKQANYDSLTGIPNRFFFEKKLNEIISKSIINNNHFAILFIDLDYFKDINDNFGYHLGDKLLYQVAQRLKNCIREIDILARFGGDEFTVILAEIKEKEDIKKICSKIISEIEKPFIIQNHLFNISSSIGITCFPEDTTNFEELLQNADKAMYVAKENGRNCFNFFNKDLDLIYKQRLELSNDLKKSIDNHELELFAQPIVDSKTGKIVKAEILLRWKHSTKGYISPNEFIPISEKNGMIHPIGEWVFNTATNWFKSFLHNNPQHSYFQISINVSPLQFMNSNFVQNLKCHLKNLNLPQGSVIIEITEGILLDNNNNTFNKFLELKELGIKIAIDDFGTGYSAFSYLYKYDIDFIKIDKSFISNLKKDKNKKITRSLVSMAKNLGIQVIAEGVETHEQAKFLKDIQCEYLQGFLFSKPIPISKFNL